MYSLGPFENEIVYVMVWYHFILSAGSRAGLSGSKSLFSCCVTLEAVPWVPYL